MFDTISLCCSSVLGRARVDNSTLNIIDFQGNNSRSTGHLCLDIVSSQWHHWNLFRLSSSTDQLKPHEQFSIHSKPKIHALPR